MRIWDLPPHRLCNAHLLGEHREIHAIWSILINGKKGYAHHPETLRWRGKQKALYLRHDQIAREMHHRGFHHKSPLDKHYAIGKNMQDDYVDSLDQQIHILKKKRCRCNLCRL